MKTAISIPDSQFQTAEKLAARLGLSRSELYQKALADFIFKHSDARITETLDSIYSEEHNGALDEELSRLQAKSIAEETW